MGNCPIRERTPQEQFAVDLSRAFNTSLDWLSFMFLPEPRVAIDDALENLPELQEAVIGDIWSRDGEAPVL